MSRINPIEYDILHLRFLFVRVDRKQRGWSLSLLVKLLFMKSIPSFYHLHASQQVVLKCAFALVLLAAILALSATETQGERFRQPHRQTFEGLEGKTELDDDATSRSLLTKPSQPPTTVTRPLRVPPSAVALASSCNKRPCLSSLKIYLVLHQHKGPLRSLMAKLVDSREWAPSTTFIAMVGPYSMRIPLF
ncbi:hypothetical protein AC1031_009472 [Aphanomyces cochlioides]|nr:hypothetical protein AC1031_009472 [Aphanomyces cochlioides]